MLLSTVQWIMIYVDGSLRAKIKLKDKQSYFKYIKFNKARI